MSGDRAFIDTNILIYLYSEDEPYKRRAAESIVNKNYCIISTQVLNEVSNVWFVKSIWSGEKIKVHLDNIEKVCDSLILVTRSTIDDALLLKDQLGYSYYDCLILASAMESGCDFLYSEDMSDGQIVNDRLKIVNPLKHW